MYRRIFKFEINPMIIKYLGGHSEIILFLDSQVSVRKNLIKYL